MRVIAGEFRSRRLKSIPGASTRPTPDRLRETLFDILGPRVEGAIFVDAYAGTGAVGIEALSRGAAHAYFLERSRPALDAIRQNLAALKVEPRATVVPGVALAKLTQYAAGIVFLDPPYDLEREYVAALDALGEGAAVNHDRTAFDPAEARGSIRQNRAHPPCAAGGQRAKFLRGTILVR